MATIRISSDDNIPSDHVRFLLADIQWMKLEGSESTYVKTFDELNKSKFNPNSKSEYDQVKCVLQKEFNCCVHVAISELMCCADGDELNSDNE